MADRDLFLVFSNATAGQDAEFNQWYDSVHVPDVLDVPGVESAQRYDLAPMEVPEYEGAPPPPLPAHRYLAVYQLSRSADEVMAEFLARITSGRMDLSETLDMSTVGMSTWTPHGAKVVAATT